MKNILRRRRGEKGQPHSSIRAVRLLIVLLICLNAACFFFEKNMRALQRRLDVCEAKILDARLGAEITNYRLGLINRRLDEFSHGYSPALEAMIGLFLLVKEARREQFYLAAEVYSGLFPDNPFDVEKLWIDLTGRGLITEARQ